MKILLFDVDGTLVRSGGAGRRALDGALEKLYGVKEGSKGVPLAGRTDLSNFRDALWQVLKRKPKASEVQAVMQEYLRILPREVRDSVRARTYEVVAGAKQLLPRLSRKRDVLIGLGTGNLEAGARIKLAPSGLNRYFKFGGFGSDSHLRYLLLRRGLSRALANRPRSHRKAVVPARDVVVIGDTALDVAAGKLAGFATVAVATGWDTTDNLRKARPDLLVKDLKPTARLMRFLDGNDDHD